MEKFEGNLFGNDVDLLASDWQIDCVMNFLETEDNKFETLFS